MSEPAEQKAKRIVESLFKDDHIRSRKFENKIKNAIITAIVEERNEMRDEVNHEQRKLLDGFAHPRDCSMCNKIEKPLP